MRRRVGRSPPGPSHHPRLASAPAAREVGQASRLNGARGAEVSHPPTRLSGGDARIRRHGARDGPAPRRTSGTSAPQNPRPPLNALSVPTEADWPAAWRWLAPRLDDRRVVALEGDLGAGKTTFVKAIAAALDADAAAVTSPTFSLVREYPTPAGPLLHLDLYRLDTVDEVLALDVEGLLDAARLAVVEWPGVARALLPPEVALWARIDPTPDGGRALALVTASPPDRPPGSQ